MRRYEAMVIVDARLEEGDVQKAVDKFVGAIGDVGGQVSNVDRWGNRRFAFEIDHQHEGYYFVASFTAPQTAIEPLQRTVQISDEFVRGKIVQLGPAAGNGAGAGAKGKE
jgi:small subunit ribosomal protein S6